MALRTLTTGGAPWRVLIAGGSYAGLSAALNLLDLCEGRPPRFNPAFKFEDIPAVFTGKLTRRIPVEITIVDERDGYCEFNAMNISRYDIC
jgi:hypothetical protein